MNKPLTPDEAARRVIDQAIALLESYIEIENAAQSEFMRHMQSAVDSTINKVGGFKEQIAALQLFRENHWPKSE